MFQNIDFERYSHSRISFYNRLSNFKISDADISEPILLDANFFEKIDTHLLYYINRRSEETKFTTQENREYKRIIKSEFPEVIPVFDHKGPTIYWFKINYANDISNEMILNQYGSKKNNKNGWWTKHDLRRKDASTNVLYLGKIEAALENRFLQHIGIGHNYTTALKLCKWLPDLKGLTLTFQFLKLNNEMKIYLEDIENVMWRELNPLMGASPRIKE